jgi:DNA mismatch endonuclease (patch repair protein)
VQNVLVSERWVSTAAGRHLAGRRKTDTEPEMLLRKALHALGFRYGLHRQIAKGCTPDLLLTRHRIAVFVDGDFWHGCPVHGTSEFRGPNAPLWVAKIERNQERDARANALAVAHGYRAVRIWECEVRRDPQAVANRLAALAQALPVRE